jgi:hypothetical protein
MPESFDFSLHETWEQNFARLKIYLESIDPECSAILFNSLPLLQSEDANARRDFNREICDALEVAADAEIQQRVP